MCSIREIRSTSNPAERPVFLKTINTFTVCESWGHWNEVEECQFFFIPGAVGGPCVPSDASFRPTQGFPGAPSAALKSIFQKSHWDEAIAPETDGPQKSFP